MFHRSLLLYQDESSGLSLKLLFMIIPALFLGASVYLWSSGDSSAASAALAAGLMMAVLLLAVFPRKYQIYEDHLRIVLGGPIAVTLPFERIKSIEVTGRTAFTVNLVNRIAKKYTLITTTGGLNFAITPGSNETFVERANLAMVEWRRTRVDRTAAM